jgi:CRP-like cAMP-binding protein
MRSPRDNRLLAALTEPAYQRLRWSLEHVTLPLGHAVYESDARMEHVFFPTQGVISLLNVMKNGASSEIAVTGCEGVVGISLFMGGHSTPTHAVVQCAGQDYRLPAEILKTEFERGGELQHLLLRFTRALITQMTQTAGCNRHHSVDEQLCRWLLLTLDRLPADELIMTQELIANMLGVRRERVTEAAGHLQKDGLIQYHRGKITVLDRPKLEQRACECYAVVKQDVDRLFRGAERSG